MTCRNVRNKLSAYIDGELTGAEMLAIRSHLTHCPECEREERSQRAFKRLLGAMPCVEPPSGLEERLLSAIRQEQEVARSWWPQLKMASLTAGVAAIAMFAILSLAKRPVAESVRADTTEFTAFDATRDQAYVAGSDPLSYGPIALPTDYEKR
jgi:anti-sigma factor RsiW